MSRLFVTSDLHLGHKNILNFRDGFKSQEDHDETIFDNLASTVNKRDSIIFLGDVAFDSYWLKKVASIDCAKKTLILGNHDLEHGITMSDLIATYDRIESLYSKRNMYFTHCPIHTSQFRGKSHNVHGHLHGEFIKKRGDHIGDGVFYSVVDDRYINVCADNTDFKPVLFSNLLL